MNETTMVDETTTAVGDIEERIAAGAAEIARLNVLWRPYAQVHPVLPSAVPGGRWNPRRLIEKLDLGIRIDDATVALERDKAVLARAQRAALDVAAEIAALEQAREEAEAALAAARAALQTAEAGYRTAARAVEGRRAGIKAAAVEVARAEAAARRWEREGEKERGQLRNAETFARTLEYQRAAEALPLGVV